MLSSAESIRQHETTQLKASDRSDVPRTYESYLALAVQGRNPCNWPQTAKEYQPSFKNVRAISIVASLLSTRRSARYERENPVHEYASLSVQYMSPVFENSFAFRIETSFLLEANRPSICHANRAALLHACRHIVFGRLVIV